MLPDKENKTASAFLFSVTLFTCLKMQWSRQTMRQRCVSFHSSQCVLSWKTYISCLEIKVMFHKEVLLRFLLWREWTGNWREWKETDFNMNFSCLRSETNVTLWPSLKSEDFLPFCLCLSGCVVRVRRLVVMHCSQHPCLYPPFWKLKDSSFLTLHDSSILPNQQFTE